MTAIVPSAEDLAKLHPPPPPDIESPEPTYFGPVGVLVRRLEARIKELETELAAARAELAARVR